jgi:hypothetical protein
MARLLVVHGTAGPHRTDASVRLEWVTSMLDGLALAGYPCPDLDPEVAVVNLDDGTAAGTAAHSAAGPAPDAAWEAAVLDRCWRAARFDAGPPGRAAGSIAGRLAWSRYFSGLPADELTAALREVRAHLLAGGPGRLAADRVRAAIAPDTRVVLGHCVGALAALRAVAALDPATAPVLVTIGAPLGLFATVGAATPAPAPGRWIDIADVHDTLVLAGGVGGASAADGAGEDERAVRVTLDCDPRLRCARNYLASPEFGKVLGELR